MPKDFKEKFPSREPTDISLARFTAEKSAVAQISLTYMKRLITPTYLTLASPGGMAVPYEGGYCCLALMARDWTNEKALVKNILDKFASLQNSDGSWYQQIYPWGANSEYEDRKVDSGASLIAWAMADYDQRNASTTYQSNWQAAMRFLKSLEWVPGAAGKSILKNQVINGVKEEISFAADVSEAILAGVRGLDAYGSTVQFGDGDTEQVKDFISRLVAGIDEYHWKSDYEWYQTEYPLGAQSESSPGVFITFEQLISYTQALCAWALKKWDTGYGTPDQHDANSKKALDRAIVGTGGRFGGFLYHGTWNYTDPTEEYPHYAALMRIAMNTLDPTRYAKWISAALDFMRKAALSDGQVLDRVLSTGMAYVNPEAWGPLLVTCASCILAGA